MPLHISEIGVRIDVGDAPAPEPATPQPADSAPVPAGRLRTLVQACVNKVLRTLRLRESR